MEGKRIGWGWGSMESILRRTPLVAWRSRGDPHRPSEVICSSSQSGITQSELSRIA